MNAGCWNRKLDAMRRSHAWRRGLGACATVEMHDRTAPSPCRQAWDQTRSPQRGNTLIEVTVSLLLVGVVLVAALRTTGGVAKATLAASTQLDAQLMAGELMAEMLAMPYFDPQAADENELFGIEAGEPSPVNRAGFDDLDDYNGWVEGSALQTRDGAARMDTAGWGRSATVEKVDASNPTAPLGNAAIDQGVRRITVTVTSPIGDTTTLQSIRALHGAMEQPPAVDTTFVTGVIVELTTGTTAVTDATAILNHASGP